MEAGATCTGRKPKRWRGYGARTIKFHRPNDVNGPKCTRRQVAASPSWSRPRSQARRSP